MRAPRRYSLLLGRRAGVDRVGCRVDCASIRDKEVDNATITLLKKRDICVCPTLTRKVSTFVYESRPAFFDDPFFLREADSKVIEELQDPKRMEAMRASEAARRYKAALEVAKLHRKKRRVPQWIEAEAPVTGIWWARQNSNL